ncbi:MAG: hypothetical protein WCE44_11175 [Candidatus Velthaea sp.]|jgi:hypothetical protein
MDISSVTSAASAGAANSVNLNVLKDTQNLAIDVIDRLFATLGVGTNISAAG